MAESKVAALGKEMRAVKREHAEQVKPLRALIDVLREQVAASNEERDKAVAAAKSKGGPPVHQGKEQLEGLLNEENLRLMNVPQQQRFQGEQRDPTSAQGHISTELQSRAEQTPGPSSSNRRAAFEREFTEQSQEIEEILNTVQLVRKKLLASEEEPPPLPTSTRGHIPGEREKKLVTNEMFKWNKTLEKQNISLERQLVVSHGELAATKQALERATAENHRLRVLATEAERLREKRALRHQHSRRAITNDTKKGRKKLLGIEADADAAIREAQAVQIELLERETDALKSELLQQRLLVHRLTSYQDE